jgi:para-nitrobenzyl esterase
MKELAGIVVVGTLMTIGTAGAAPVKTDKGAVLGTTAASGVRVFKGIPYAAPPVGALRWKAPQPAAAWTGVRKADAFGARCPQVKVWDDIVFRDEMSEDCLYLNVWAPADAKKLPVMVWIHGGGFIAGSGSEPRQDGERMAGKGVVVVNLNYRMGVFGFFSHPDLTKESPRHASGNYGMQDQIAALAWVKANIAAFGGDPGNVTIFGESAGSFAVSALMSSPAAKGLFHRVIGESGAFFTAGDQTLAPKSLAESEQGGVKLAETLKARDLAALRGLSVDDLLKATTGEGGQRFGPNLDGIVLTEPAHATFKGGRQNDVPLLAGWNEDEIRSAVTLAPVKPTPQAFADEAKKRFGAHADAILRAYPAGSDAEAIESAAALTSDLFIGYATWKWIEMQAQHGRAPVYGYSFDRDIPLPKGHTVNGVPVSSRDIGARHAGEIEYVFGALDSLPTVPWEDADRRLSDLMMTYWTNFARTGDPNGPGLPVWPRYSAQDGTPVMHLNETSAARPDERRPRYLALDAYTDTLRRP